MFKVEFTDEAEVETSFDVNEIENPHTVDNILTSLLITSISFIGLIIYLKKNRK